MIPNDEAFIFDVDGPLTPSRSKIDPVFLKQFTDFQRTHNTYLVTGSDFPKTIEQLGVEPIQLAKKTFNCCGNECREKGVLIYKNEWDPQLDDSLWEYLHQIVYDDPYPLEYRNGINIEVRNGTLNFSIVGRGANAELRNRYHDYDVANSHRMSIMENINYQFPHLIAQIGGVTGLDIMPRGKDKSQALKHIPEGYKIFFGDAIFYGGNDHEIAINCNYYYQCYFWQTTAELLKREVNGFW